MAAASAPAAARRCGGASERVCHAATPASRASHTLTGRAAQALCAARGKGKCREGEGNTSMRKAPYVRSYENRRSAPRRGSGTISALRRGAMSAVTARQTPELDAPTARRISLVLRCIHLGRREVEGRCRRVSRRDAPYPEQHLNKENFKTCHLNKENSHANTLSSRPLGPGKRYRYGPVGVKRYAVRGPSGIAPG